MSARLTPREILERVATGLPAARWDVNEEADELELILPGTEGREGRAVLINDEFYLRLDVRTNEPLSLIIPSVSLWLGQELDALRAAVGDPPEAAPGGAPPPAWPADSHGAVAQALSERLRDSADLAAAVA
jgi:hypothetical protein